MILLNLDILKENDVINLIIQCRKNSMWSKSMRDERRPRGVGNGR